jgi:hypothetical protein
MNNKLENYEVKLVGQWLEKDGSVVADDVCLRIEWLVFNELEQLSVNSNEWSALYRKHDDNTYWELSYPQSHLHGAGPPTLERISKEKALMHYEIILD